jgi:ubiquinone/menaquinone biosynthesis C-methylase UbiE
MIGPFLFRFIVTLISRKSYLRWTNYIEVIWEADMNPFKGRLKEISGGKILDVGTMGGDYIGILIEEFKDYDEAIGIDIDDEHFEEARKKYDGKPVRFMKMDATAMEFEDESFNTVAMHAAVHHLMEPEKVFKEVRRVLKPGGLLIISEEICDNVNEKEMLNIKVHTWMGKVDRLVTFPQNPTFKKQMIIDLLNPLGLAKTEMYEFKCHDCDPGETEKLAKLFKELDKELEKVKQFPEHARLKDEAEHIRQDINTIGYDCPPYLVVIASK